MDKAKLESLRARYSNGDVFDATDPPLRRAAAAVAEFFIPSGRVITQ